MVDDFGVSLYDGKMYHLKNDGLGTRGYVFDCPGHSSINLDLSIESPNANTVIMVHGFRYDTKSKGKNNPHLSTFPHWRENILSRTSAFGFGWWSCPGGLMLPNSIRKSILAGRWNTYRYAWDLAEEAGRGLAKIIIQFPHPVTLLCHSLGSRVVLGAVESDLALPVKRVVLLNGAELNGTALRIARKRQHIKFFNLVVKEDEVLKKFGERFAPEDGVCIGRVGLGSEAPQNWVDLDLDSLVFKTWASSQGWPDVQGDNPSGYFDHWWTHKHEGNWPLIYALLKSEGINPPRFIN